MGSLSIIISGEEGAKAKGIEKAYNYANDLFVKHRITMPYTGEPYINHCLAVAQFLIDVLGQVNCSMEKIQAALLHDTAEMCMAYDNYYLAIYDEFGELVADMVNDLTQPFIPQRKARLLKYNEQLQASCLDTQDVKLSDIYINISTIVQRDKRFAKQYLGEKTEQLAYLTGTSPKLKTMVLDMLDQQKALL